MSGTVTGLDLDQLEELAEKLAAGATYDNGRAVQMARYSNDDVLALIAAVPSLLAAARAVQRVEALLEKAESDQWWVRTVDGGKPPAILNADQVRAALGTEQEGRQ